jgi:hypothetical protein
VKGSGEEMMRENDGIDDEIKMRKEKSSVSNKRVTKEK